MCSYIVGLGYWTCLSLPGSASDNFVDCHLGSATGADGYFSGYFNARCLLILTTTKGHRLKLCREVSRRHGTFGGSVA